MLHPHIQAWIIHAKAVGLVTSIVSNGTGIDRAFLSAMEGHLDWVGLSIDASTDALHADLGRGEKKELRNGMSGHLARTLPVADLLHEFGVGVKLNTVVTALNQDDDMSAVVRRIRPDRWKIFQALRIEGENDDEILISRLLMRLSTPMLSAIDVLLPISGTSPSSPRTTRRCWARTL